MKSLQQIIAKTLVQTSLTMFIVIFSMALLEVNPVAAEQIRSMEINQYFLHVVNQFLPYVLIPVGITHLFGMSSKPRNVVQAFFWIFQETLFVVSKAIAYSILVPIGFEAYTLNEISSSPLIMITSLFILSIVANFMIQMVSFIFNAVDTPEKSKRLPDESRLSTEIFNDLEIPEHSQLLNAEKMR